MGNVTKYTQVYLIVDMGICSFGFALSMGTHMVFISLMVLKVGKILFSSVQVQRRNAR